MGVSMSSRKELCAVVCERFRQREAEAMAIVDQALSIGVPIVGACMWARDATDFESWRHEMEDWIEWRQSDDEVGSGLGK
jgi:hypothetical protein